MKEIYSNAEDCHNLAIKLEKKLSSKILFSVSTRQEVVSGKFYSLTYDKYNDYDEYKKSSVDFSYKYFKDGFLRISIYDTINTTSLGHKLAILSDFYEILVNDFGNPTVFYTISSKKNNINIQWSFINKEEDIQDFQNNTIFTDAKIDKLIILNTSQELAPKTQNMISKNIKMPYELLPLLNENIDEFVKYKYGQINKFESLHKPKSLKKKK